MLPFRSSCFRARVDRSACIPKPALAGGAALLVCAFVGIFIGFAGCSPTPTITADSPDERFAESSDGSVSSSSDSEDVRANDDAVIDGEVSDSGKAVASAAMVTVHVAGAVQSCGVYELPDGARVRDAVDAAGGLRDDAAEAALNLARKLSDGEQIYVPTQDQAVPAGAAGNVSSPSSAAGQESGKGQVNINRASVEELDALPGVGPATAQAIVDEREANGPFASVEDIQRVTGIGEKKFEKLEGSICV